MSVPWDSTEANPIADLCAWRDRVAEVSDTAGYKPPVIITSAATKARYEAAILRDRVLREEIERTSRRCFVRRYVLRRLRGDSRLRIIAPRLDRLLYRVEFRWNEWRHRHDPGWDL